MENIKPFDEWVDETKTYADSITPAEFKNIKVGTKVGYYGNTYEVMANDGYVITLKDEDGDTKDVNLGMFNRKGYLR
jgi:hypothetical protein